MCRALRQGMTLRSSFKCLRAYLLSLFWSRALALSHLGRSCFFARQDGLWGQRLFRPCALFILSLSFGVY